MIRKRVLCTLVGEQGGEGGWVQQQKSKSFIVFSRFEGRGLCHRVGQQPPVLHNRIVVLADWQKVDVKDF